MSPFKPNELSKSGIVFQWIKRALFFKSKQNLKIVVGVACEKLKRSDLSTESLSAWISACEKADATFAQIERAQLENKIRCYKTKALKTVVGEGGCETGESDIKSACARKDSWPLHLQLHNPKFNLKKI